MGYEISIVRYKGDEAIAIAKSEWLDYVQTDPELELSIDSDSEDPYFEWNAHSLHGDPAGGRPWFHFSGGAIYSKNPDREVAAKMVRMASVLGARVVGESGEVYDADGEAIDPEEATPDPVRNLPPGKPWWRFW